MTGLRGAVRERLAGRERALAGIRAGEPGTDLHDHGVETTYAAAIIGRADPRHAERQP